MDLEKLTDNEVNELIHEAKHFLENFVLSVPLGKFKENRNVLGESSNLEYIWFAYRGALESKYSLHIRFKQNNVHLVRLCINGSNHHNYDGTIVNGNHIHIYKYANNNIFDYAYPLDDYIFNSTDKLGDAIHKFLNFVHIGGDNSDTLK
ncbi:hypothetical protein J2Z60_000133 [Lactobacillus colini]|uniref:Lj965 prophage protein n=1 Tax=Lactobacillus colini TaxID=1819254 RepID=A0ABS4MCA5_9LACO|nr:hypothetical protein [Lactobacillus colini]MBP2056971.1 hypothetical protein [Lactobacillus colini]